MCLPVGGTKDVNSRWDRGGRLQRNALMIVASMEAQGKQQQGNVTLGRRWGVAVPGRWIRKGPGRY